MLILFFISSLLLEPLLREHNSIITSILYSITELATPILFIPTALLLIKYASLFFLKLRGVQYLGDYTNQTVITSLITIICFIIIYFPINLIVSIINPSALLEELFFSIVLISTYSCASYAIRVKINKNNSSAFIFDLIMFSIFWLIFSYILSTIKLIHM